MRRESSWFLGGIAIVALAGVCWLVFQMVLMDAPPPPAVAEDGGGASLIVEELHGENQALRQRVDRLEADLSLATRRLGDVLARLDQLAREPRSAPGREAGSEEPAPEAASAGSPAELAPVEGLSPTQHLAVREVIDQVQREEEQRREEARLQRDLERTERTVDRLAEQLGLSARQRDEVNRLYSREVMARREIYRGFDFEFADDEERGQLREESNRLREERDAAVLPLLDVAQAEKFEEMNSRRFRRGREAGQRIQLGGAASPRRDR